MPSWFLLLLPEYLLAPLECPLLAERFHVYTTHHRTTWLNNHYVVLLLVADQCAPMCTHCPIQQQDVQSPRNNSRKTDSTYPYTNESTLQSKTLQAYVMCKYAQLNINSDKCMIMKIHWKDIKKHHIQEIQNVVRFSTEDVKQWQMDRTRIYCKKM